MNNDNILLKQDNQLKYAAYDITQNDYINNYFSQNNVNFISKKVTELLKGLDEYGRDIVVTDRRILEVMNTVYRLYTPAIGFDQRRTVEKYISDMIGQCIRRIVDDVSYTIGYAQCQSKKTIWTTVLGDFNAEGLRSHAPIKLRNKRPNSFEFNMNY